MAHSKAITKDELKLVQDILNRMQSQGLNPTESLSGLTPPGSDSFTLVDDIPFGGMTDACKRRGEGSGSQEFTRARVDRPTPTTETVDAQLPVVPAAEGEFPPGITSLEEWGTTVCELPQMKHLNKTYEQLMKDPEVDTYLRWVLRCGHTKGARASDFRSYLMASGFSLEEKSDMCFPGSNQVRKLRPSK